MHPNFFQRIAFLAAASGWLAAPVLRAATLSSYFLEPRAPVLALSADGKFFAYEEPPVSGRLARVVIMDVFGDKVPAELPLVAPPVGVDRVEFLGWAPTGRLVVGTSAGRVFSIGPDARDEKDCSAARAKRPSSDRADFPEVLDESKGLRATPNPPATPDLTTDRRDGIGGTENGMPEPTASGRRSAGASAEDKEPKALRVIAIRPGTEQVVVEAHERTDDRGIPAALIEFNAGSGRTRTLPLPNRWVGQGRYLYDNEGRARIFVPAESGNFEWAHHHGFSDWQALNDYWGSADFRFVRPANGTAGVFAVPLGLGDDASILYVASNTGEERYGIYQVDLAKKTSVRLDHGFGEFDAYEPGIVGAEPALVREPSTGKVVGVRALGQERSTLWLDSEFKRIQALVENDFPGRSVSLQCWDEGRREFIAIVSSESDPGRIFLFSPAHPDLPIELLRRCPRLERDDLPLAEAFSFRLPDGDLMSGYLSRPRAATVGPAPLVLIVGPGYGERALPGFDADAAALAKLGYAVARINEPGSSGISLSHARTGGHTPAEDSALKACADWLAARFPVKGGQVALLARAGALRTVAVANADPTRFPCAILIEASRRSVDRRKIAPDSPPLAHLWVAGGGSFAAAFHDQGATVEFFPTKGRIEDLTPAGRAELVQKMADFLAEHGLGSALLKKKWFWQ